MKTARKTPDKPVEKRLSLGNYTKNFANPVITGLEANQANEKNRYIRQRRLTEYELLNEARSIYLNDAKKQNLELKFNRHKTAKCRYISTGGDVQVKANTTNASYSNLVKCGRVWTCPCCASSIQERRRIEVGQAVSWAHCNGYKVIMLTFTNSHTKDNEFKLKETLKAKQKALKALRASREWKALKELDYQGFVRSLEVTLGGNGWHVHTHEMLIVSRNADAQEIRDRLFLRYKHLCIKYGLLDPNKKASMQSFNERGVHVLDNPDCQAYLTKSGSTKAWGVDSEMTKSSKKATESGKTKKTKSAFSLLENRSPTNDRLWLEYSDSMHGQKQLNWSLGLKAKVGIGEVSDEEVIDSETDAMDYLASFTSKQWQWIRKNRLQAQMLNLVEQNLPNGVAKVVYALNEYLASNGQPTLRHYLIE